MKLKTCALFLMAVFTVSAFAQKQQGVVIKASVGPVLDGIPDAVWDEANVYDILRPFQATIPTLGTPGETNWRALWTDDGVYVMVTVTDDEFLPNWKDNPPGAYDWQYDKTEIYFDCNYILEDGVGCYYGDDEGHHQYAPDNAEAHIGGTVVESSQGFSSATLVTDPNYVVEYYMPWDILVDKEDILVDKTRIIGFDVTIRDRETGDADYKRAVWENIGKIDESWANMDDCGLITFEGAEEAIQATSLVLTGGDITENNGKLQIGVAFLPEDVSTKKLHWSVENGTGRASVNSDGVVTGIIDGTVTVTGATIDGSYLNESVEVTISNQIITKPELNLIRNGYFDEVTGTGSAAQWSGIHQVNGGVCVLDPPEGGVNTWDFAMSQENFGCNTTDMYTFSFVTWAEKSGTFDVDFEDDEAHSWNRYGSSTHEFSLGGESEWVFQTNTEPTRYDFDVIFDEKVEDTRESVQFMVGLHGSELYIDSIELVNNNDLALITPDYVPVEVINVTGGTVAVGGTLQLSAEVLPAEATLTGVNWSVVPGTGDATIDANGLLTGDAAGTVMVYAMAKDDSKVMGSVQVDIGFSEGVARHRVNTLKVYPNPAVNELNVVLTRENSMVAIYNSIGLKMEEVTVTGTEHRFNISSYAPGIYFVKTGNTVAKFVK